MSYKEISKIVVKWTSHFIKTSKNTIFQHDEDYLPQARYDINSNFYNAVEKFYNKHEDDFVLLDKFLLKQTKNMDKKAQEEKEKKIYEKIYETIQKMKISDDILNFLNSPYYVQTVIAVYLGSYDIISDYYNSYENKEGQSERKVIYNLLIYIMKGGLSN